MPATLPRGLIVLDTPSAGGNMLSQKTLGNTISTIIRVGIVLKGTVLYTHRVRSFTVLMYR